ncbi:hypothetical protein GALMADRAFT_24825, partial [Galerina marginata CBS 339.88]
IIKNWEQAMAMDQIRVVVCAACSLREMAGKTELVDGCSIDFTLLRNDDLPIHLRPVSYNFFAYNRAILDPAGLTSLNTVDQLILCQNCHSSLQRSTMPKFALCNWLYYAKDRLPHNVQNAFKDSTIFERMMIARARCNSVCCRFNYNATEHVGGQHSETLSRLRKGIKGNIMVAPLDVVRMNKVLPPSSNMIRDTMCAVFVGDRLPSRSSISKFGPILVRKTRVECMLHFLLTKNLHYEPDSNFQFSQHNLDELFHDNDESGVPRSVHIGHLPSNDAIELSTSDYTPRNENIDNNCEATDELMMENVGYTDGDESAMAYQAMKLLALERCLAGKPFIASGTGNKPVPDFNNPSILTWLFPHLDPWGIGGFHDPRRLVKLTMAEQVSHMLRMNDRSFQEDSEFAFVFYNVIRKAEISKHVRFRVPAKVQTRIIRDLTSIDPEDLLKLYTLYEKDPSFRPVEQEHQRIAKILQDVTMMTKSLPGSNGYKISMRNQIRAIINLFGAPILFITLNPSDIDHPLVRILAGDTTVDLDDIFRGEDMDSWRRRIFAAKNPSACALFFDFMVQTFIKVILCHGTGQAGLFGFCEAYYGAVEAQGKGTLHVHMLVWLRGHLSPQKLQDAILSSDDYKKKVVDWLESIIMNEFPVVSETRNNEPSRAIRVRSSDLGVPHPGTIKGPSLTILQNVSEDQFWMAYHDNIIQLLHEYNWHVHNATCWKNLKPNQDKTAKNCRMRMDGVLHQETYMDPLTGAIQLRRLHPAIASYNDLATFLMKCNLNIQFIGSGDAAKAYMYYVTDYITKPVLPMHIGLAALSYAIKKTDERRTDDQNENSPEFCAKALTTLVNSMMGRQEISHQQVMSYLVGGGDFYTSETFQVLNFGAFLRYISFRMTNTEARLEIPILPEHEIQTETNEHVYLAIEEGEICVSSQIYDYSFRPLAEPYNSMCLYDFIACTIKKKIVGNKGDMEGEGRFSSWDHPQRASYRMYLRRERVLPVILGPTIANPARSSASKDLWSRDLLVLFKPWREPDEIKDPTSSWTEAFDNFKDNDEFQHEKIVQNMTVLTEGAD